MDKSTKRTSQWMMGLLFAILLIVIMASQPLAAQQGCSGLNEGLTDSCHSILVSKPQALEENPPNTPTPTATSLLLPILRPKGTVCPLPPAPCNPFPTIIMITNTPTPTATPTGISMPTATPTDGTIYLPIIIKQPQPIATPTPRATNTPRPTTIPSNTPRPTTIPSATPTTPTSLPTTLYPIADTMVLEGDATENVGSFEEMWTGYHEASCRDIPQTQQTTRSFIKFDMSSIPPETDITEANLYVYVVDFCGVPDPFRPRTLIAYSADESWLESSVTWNTRPDYGDRNGGIVLIVADDQEPGVWYEIDVTPLVTQWVDGSFPNNGFMLKADENPANNPILFAFATREHSDTTLRPYLSITYD